ncbi:hypothetical protein C1H46_021061 [Malus baccata]|uniref:Dehydrogenase E1 component domain-containing protein n=1 Tax=Malus baccata TaxID=106549 RepID=A0A540M3I8_MALBA|nr:hypothetical protein C1H46_021061 [Malus baccata]
MPIHYGSNKLNYVTVASTVASQLPHAVGAAYSLKMDRKDACVVVYVGDGGTSEEQKEVEWKTENKKKIEARGRRSEAENIRDGIERQGGGKE